MTLNDPADLPTGSRHGVQSRIPSRDSAYPLRPPFVVTGRRERAIVDALSIGYAFRPHLRDRLTLSGRTLLRKP